ncbi:MAG: Gfo/Idh/MocA family oxidoreductase [Tannerellaceae bacterium]|jgi:predicted dehydrogenase|nr:Gfo/Idh/MocA family oxidoreductase [Tannerellaceae bacterium]
MKRRQFIAASANAGLGLGLFSVIPSHVFAASKKGLVPPSDRITMVHIAAGSESLNEIGPLLRAPAIEIVGIADPNRESYDYIHWSPNGLRDSLRRIMDEPGWKAGKRGIPGGRDVMKEVVETYYRKNRPGYKGSVAVAEDYRELLDKIKDVDAVKIMSPDHLHAWQALDCLRRGKHIIMHKPLGNKMAEAMQVVDAARASDRSTFLMPYNAFSSGNMNRIRNWIEAGAIGTLREIHNWSNRPVWPQYPNIPTDKPPVPDGFNWDLYLGPAEWRDYHPHYTFCTFRGWYEFGAGAIADMGYYSLWPVFDALGLDTAVSASSRFSRTVETASHDGCLVPFTVENDFSYPTASALRFEVPYKNKPGKIILQWHDGGMKPAIPDGFEGDDLPIEGMMFIGDNGVILSGFLRENPYILGERAKEWEAVQGEKMPNFTEPAADGTETWLQMWMDGCKGKAKGPASFEFAKEINETFNLGSISLMRQGKRLTYDPATRSITNDPEGHLLLTRKVRKGWEF